MIYFDIIVTVCVIIAIAIMLIVPSLFGGLLSKRQDKYSDMLSSFTNHVKDLLSGFEIIKSYRMKKYVLSRFETSNEDTIKAKYSVDKAIAANEAVSMVLALLVQVVVVFFRHISLLSDVSVQEPYWAWCRLAVILQIRF